jgi:hypothetical protein
VPTRARSESKAPAPKVELSPGPSGLRRVLVVAGAFYIGSVFLEGSGASLDRTLPRPILFFCQIAKLFPNAATYSIEYRAQGYGCNGRVAELDVRPFFPIHADDKENRFDRALFFYRQDRTVMQALEAYVMREHNRDDPDKIGGVSFMSLRIPIPPPGAHFDRYERKPLADYPADYRKVWYTTPHDTVLRHCRGGTL